MTADFGCSDGAQSPSNCVGAVPYPRDAARFLHRFPILSHRPHAHIMRQHHVIEGDEIIVESRRPQSDWLKDAVPETKKESELLRTVTQRLDRWKVSRFGADKIEIQNGGPLIRATSRRGI